MADPHQDDSSTLRLSDAEFDAAVEDALEQIPPELARVMRNVAMLVDDEPPTGEHVLGLYEGVPLTERDSWWDAGAMPDRITIFKGPLERLCRNREELLDEIAVTVVHEVAHHFGIDDATLHDLGWG